MGRRWLVWVIITRMDLSQRADQLFAAAEAQDWATFRAGFADDAVIARNVGGAESIDDAMKTIPLLTRDGSTLRYENARRLVGERSVTEMHDVVLTKPDGDRRCLDVCVVVEFNDDGQVVRIDEYFDAAQARAMTR